MLSMFWLQFTIPFVILAIISAIYFIISGSWIIGVSLVLFSYISYHLGKKIRINEQQSPNEVKQE